MQTSGGAAGVARSDCDRWFLGLDQSRQQRSGQRFMEGNWANRSQSGKNPGNNDQIGSKGFEQLPILLCWVIIRVTMNRFHFGYIDDVFFSGVS